MAQELKAYNVVATADVNPDVVDILGCTEWAGYDKEEADKAFRKLQRALWLARAELADSKVSYWCVRFGVESGFTKVDIYGYSVNTKRKLRTIKEWFEMWKNVERKCRAKADKFKEAKWLSQGKGEWRYEDSDRVHANIGFGYNCNKQHEIVDEKVKIRKWDDTEWHEPTVDYLGIKDKEEGTDV